MKSSVSGSAPTIGTSKNGCGFGWMIDLLEPCHAAGGIDITVVLLTDELLELEISAVPIAVSASRAFRRNGQAMNLNNAGDEIALLDNSGNARDRFEYASSVEGTRIITGH